MYLQNKLSVSLMLVLLSLIAVVPALGQGPNEFDADWTYTEHVDCANDGAGELVDMTGTIHLVDAGDVFHANLQNATGVGRVTGDVYRAIGAATETWIFNDGAEVFAIIDHFRIIGPGPDNNLLINMVLHVTINGNGEVTAVVDSFSAECR